MLLILKKLILETNLSQSKAWKLLEFIFSKNKEQLILIKRQNIDKSLFKRINYFKNLIIFKNKPIEYIIKEIDFLNLKIKIKKPILIPRIETEEFVAKLCLEMQNQKLKKILDIGTGSGVIGLSFAKFFPDAIVFLTDINNKALKLSKDNSKINNLKNVKFINSDIFENISKESKFDIIISNPPYIDLKFKNNLEKTVIKWEDERALFAKKKGMFLIKKIILNAKYYLLNLKNLEYNLFLEIDDYQKKDLKKFLEKKNLYFKFEKDSFLKYRFLKIKI